MSARVLQFDLRTVGRVDESKVGIKRRNEQAVQGRNLPGP